MPETSSDNNRLSAGQLKHDLNNPVSQLLGFSEILIEDLRELGETGDLDKVNEACKIVRELHGSIDSQFSAGVGYSQDAVSERLVVQLKACIEPAVARIVAMRLEHCTFAKHEPHAEDVKRILNAAASLRSILEGVLARIREGMPL